MASAADAAVPVIVSVNGGVPLVVGAQGLKDEGIRLLLEAKKGGKPGLSYETDLVLFSPDGTETPEYRTIYHRNT